ncbi:MAG: hypothetical protein R3A46_02905 [Thermomicrobiales bacterium]
MTNRHTNQSDNGRDSIDLLLDRGLSSRLTIVLGPDAEERKKALNEWLDRRRYEVLLVECPPDNGKPACPRVILDAFVEAGIVKETPRDPSSEASCNARLITLMNELAALQRDLVVVFLNYQQREATNRMLSFMLEHLPEQVHIYLCCDHAPALNCIPRLRVRRQLQTVETGYE